MRTKSFMKKYGVACAGSETFVNKDAACEYIKNTDMRISEIAQECNFCTSSYFCEKFKSFMKMTPNEYRKENLTRFFVSEKK